MFNKLITIVGLTLANYASAKLVVMSPESLKERFASEKYIINAVYANYGSIPYGRHDVSSYSKIKD